MSGGMFIAAPLAEQMVGGLKPFGVEDVGTDKWRAQANIIQQLNTQAHANVAMRGDEYVMEAFCTFEKFGVLVHELIVMEVWQAKVLPRLMRKADRLSVGGVYMAMHHEAVVLNLLECMLYHKVRAPLGIPLV
jgi:zinc finger MYND domain-containing protein 10